MWKPVLAAIPAMLYSTFTFAAGTASCEQVLKQLASQLMDATCVESADLTTRNPATTPEDNAIKSLPPFAFMPRSDRAILMPDERRRTPILKAVPGLQIQARFVSDPLQQGRFLLRLPKDWNGRLVIAGASGARSEFNGDFAWSDYLVQKGYAYASQNKGVLSSQSSQADDPLACRTAPDSDTYVRYYDNEAGQEFTRWRDFMVLAARVARQGVQFAYGKAPRYTYAVGTSNGGYQVRRAVESAPEQFDGGVEWAGTYVGEPGPNLLTALPPAIRNFQAYQDSGYAADSLAARNLLAAGYPPDLIIEKDGKKTSFLAYHSMHFWEPTQCQWQKRLDPDYNTYGAGPGNYNYLARLSASGVGKNVAAIATTGHIRRPLITVAGTMDGLLPIDLHARAYARQVAAQAGRNAPAYRLYEIQNGNHVESLADDFPQLELMWPHAQHAFDLLVAAVEQKKTLPPAQCVPRGARIAEQPAQPGHCVQLLQP
ncbi:3-hydroxybutyrate oligomer hydrolase family protein [Undibacterium luofuense]|uniref:Tannase/feruloyl esterase family alpha/beta hydrolase n=1 Tax=Undibacterium luofuense TaxID=2828733 RepID=A0A941I699_9BURK|nr:3-hydroxybutyrate oligomer hydrolase family protein [Undibacterium luofuense]MBR7781614.1 tannase/feruloyl esterase family alpha/beta hydrolase [Undibacterium luofuense]